VPADGVEQVVDLDGMEAREGSRRCRARNCQPSITGIIRSRRIRHGCGSARRKSRASWPLAAGVTA
jgi:hypothetical protein